MLPLIHLRRFAFLFPPFGQRLRGACIYSWILYIHTLILCIFDCHTTPVVWLSTVDVGLEFKIPGGDLPHSLGFEVTPMEVSTEVKSSSIWK